MIGDMNTPDPPNLGVSTRLSKNRVTQLLDEREGVKLTFSVCLCHRGSWLMGSGGKAVKA